MQIEINKILCPVDFSDTTEYTLEYARMFARAHGSQLQLMHVIETSFLASFPTPFDDTSKSTYDEYGVAGLRSSAIDVEGLVQAAKGRLDELAEQYKGDGYLISSDVQVGDPFMELTRAARESHFDLIVMGTHGQTGLRNLIIGSVAEKVVRKSSCPVLTIKPNIDQSKNRN